MGASEGELEPLTNGGVEGEPAWLNPTTVLYTAPVAPNGLDAIWQIDTSGGSAEIFAGSGLLGISDAQPAVSLGGSAVAIVSTRGGDGNMWLRQLAQISDLQVTPHAGAAPGEDIQVSYTLPSSATVSLVIEDSDGKTVRSILAEAAQEKGPQEVDWDGRGSDGEALAPGEYLVNLSANLDSGFTLTRRAGALLLAPNSKGTLKLDIEPWTGQPTKSSVYVSVLIYNEGARTNPVAQDYGSDSLQVALPAGRYDALVLYNGRRSDIPGIKVVVGKETVQKVDLGLGELNFNLVMSAGHPVVGDAYVTVSVTGDPSGVNLQASYSSASSFVLPPGRYDLKAQLGKVRKTISNVQVARGQVTDKEVSLESGNLMLTIYSHDDSPAKG